MVSPMLTCMIQLRGGIRRQFVKARNVCTDLVNPSNSTSVFVVICPLWQGQLHTTSSYSTHVIPFDGANLDQKSLEINGIDPFHPLRAARAEREALAHIFTPIRQAVSDAGCTRAILVGHNAFFDLKFVQAAADRTGIKRNPFHPFSCFDTVSLCGLAYGQTVLARGAAAAGMNWDTNEAHSAIYDTRMTAELFCKVVNRWEALHAADEAPASS